MTDLMYLSSTKSICHIGEKVVKSTTYLMYLSHSISICCVTILVVETKSEVNLGISYKQKAVIIAARIFAVCTGEQGSFQNYSTKSESTWCFCVNSNAK